MPLVHGQISRWGATVAETRLTFQDPSNAIVQGLWALEHRVSPANEWTPSYTFALTEFFPKDFEIMNYAVRSRPTSFWTYSILCLRMIFDEEVDDITGLLVLQGDRLKQRMHTESETLMQCADEHERVEVLEKHFGIHLSHAEQLDILGTVTQLKGGFSLI